MSGVTWKPTLNKKAKDCLDKVAAHLLAAKTEMRNARLHVPLQEICMKSMLEMSECSLEIDRIGKRIREF